MTMHKPEAVKIMSHLFPVPPVVLFSDADVLHHFLHLLQLTNVQFSVADPDPGSGAFMTPGSGAFLTPRSGIRCLFDPWIRDPVPFLPLDPVSDAFLTPGSGIRCLFDPWIQDPVLFLPLDPGWVKNQDPDPG
jgi:hypothetical protein